MKFGVSRESVLRQLKIAVHGVRNEQMADLIFACEPVWAIGGKGISAEPGYANHIHSAIRKEIEILYGKETADHVTILYGGSVDLDYARSLVEEPEIDGLFVGRAAWEVKGLIELIKIG